MRTLSRKGWGGSTVNYEVQQIRDICPTKEPNIAIDIGANKGTYTLELLKTYPELTVFLFEPSSTNIDILRKKLEASNVRIEPFALSSSTGSAVLFSDKPGS
ncbi:FkbM family methyltransferase [Roseibium salinum]|uniref:FkbM family methyltransferase n=1 Tax=Roseibium salinum TaxID=1604349 RepID=UPI0036097D76